MNYRCECPLDECMRTSTEEENVAWRAVDGNRKDGEYIAFKDCPSLKDKSGHVNIVREEGMFVVWKYVSRETIKSV